MALETVVIKITGDSKDLDKTIDQLEKVGKVDRQNAASFKKTSKEKGKALDFVKGKAAALGATLLGAFAIQQAVGSAIRILKDFEKELATLQSITGSTAEEMEFFAKTAKEVGKVTKTSATEVVKAFTLIGSAKPELLKNGEALAEVTKQALILSKAAGITATDAATALTGAMNQFGVSAKDAAKFTDIFATSQQKGSSFIGATAEALKNVGAAANAAGLTFETTNAAIQALAKGALVGSEAGTALRGVLIKLSSQTDQEINPSLIGLTKTIENLRKRNLSLADATKLVGQEGATGLLTLIEQRDVLFELDGNLNDVGNAMNQMETNTNNLQGSIEDLDRAYEDWILEAQASNGIMKFSVDLLTELIENGAAWEGSTLSASEMLAKQRETMEELLGVNQDYSDLALTTSEIVNKWMENQRKLNEELETTEEIIKPNTIGELKKELKELRKAQDDMIPGSAELSANQARITAILTILRGEVVKTLTPMEALNKRIEEMKKELESQALAGEISNDLVKEYKDAVRTAEEAQIDLNLALEDTLKLLPIMNTELRQVSTNQPPMIEFTSALEDFLDKNQDAISTAIESEQQLFRIISNINTNRLIDIDNRETKALRALEEEGLGEEELAKKRQEIQVKADEERAKILTKQAKADKTAAIFEATIATAVAVTKSLDNPVLAAIVAGLGAAEIATIAAQPIPEFHTGKKPELKEGEIFAKILKSESVIPPEQSKKYKGAVDAMIDKRFESYVFQEYMLPMMKGMMKKDTQPFDDINIWNNQRKQIKLQAQNNLLTAQLIKSMDSGNKRRSWN